MPIYEYVCGSCGTRVEVLQKRGDAAPRCPDDRCDGGMSRVPSVHAVAGRSFGSDPLPSHCPSDGACSSCHGMCDLDD